MTTQSKSPSIPSVLPEIPADRLGCEIFKKRHHLRRAYVAGGMYKGIASRELVVRMGRAGLLAFLGTGGMKLDRLESDLQFIQSELAGKGVYGLNFLSQPLNPGIEQATVDLYLKYNVPRIEAAAFTQITPDLARYRVSDLQRLPDGGIQIPHLVMAKVSRPEVAEQFLNPPPPALIEKLLASNQITRQEAELSRFIPMADDLCVEADSGGHTDHGVAFALLPAMLRLRDDLSQKYGYQAKICVGAAGGLGAPNAIAAAFIMGADFVLTGSINQCTVEAGASEAAKDMLQQANIQDMDTVPAGDMFEMGAKVQVFKKGLLFPSRAKKLYDLYRQYNSLEEIDTKTREQIETRYFKRTFAEVYEETKTYYQRFMPGVIERAERNPKQKMALIFRWYFVRSTRLAMQGHPDERVDYQIHCGPALGAFNQWVRGTPLENWRARHVDEIAEKLMNDAAKILEDRFRQFCAPPPSTSNR
ncbi:MAG: PfaD family polyunsaturated fatty acid/polyketide biosynthesis protein [Verrucomicrobiae bacterium]|nr:PfaD family polyunsaturated fatty acid/polyketide biosynthesis protein [Verrucomicrobiae bacterium]